MGRTYISLKLRVSMNKMVGMVQKDEVPLPQNCCFNQVVVLVAIRTKEIYLWGWFGEKCITRWSEEFMQDHELLCVILDLLVKL